jgi:hypothetical protein
MDKKINHTLPCGVKITGYSDDLTRGAMVWVTKGGWAVQTYGEKKGQLNIYFTEKSLESLYGLIGSLLGLPSSSDPKLNPAALPNLYEACKEFVKKVDNHRARSANSYAQMKAAVEKAER